MSRKAPISNGQLKELLKAWEFEPTGQYVGDHQVFRHIPTGQRVHAIAAPLGRAASFEAIRKAAGICGVLQKTFLQGPPQAKRPAHRETNMVGRQRSQIRGYLLRREGDTVTADEVVKALGGGGRTARASIVAELVNLSKPAKPGATSEIRKAPDTAGVYQVPFDYLTKVVEINRGAERSGRALVPIPPELRERARELEAELGVAEAAADPTPTMAAATAAAEPTQQEAVVAAASAAAPVKTGQTARIREVFLRYRGLTVTLDQVLKELDRTTDRDRLRLGQSIGTLVRKGEVFSSRSGHYKIPADYLQVVLDLNARNAGTLNALVQIPDELLQEAGAALAPTPAPPAAVVQEDSPPAAPAAVPVPVPVTMASVVETTPAATDSPANVVTSVNGHHRQQPPTASDDGLLLVEELAVHGNQHLWRDADGKLWVAYPARIEWDT